MKYYPPSNHIYYENSDIPINKLNIKELKIITEIEKELLARAYEHLHTELDENIKFDEKYLCKVHEQIFFQLYDWAGKFRTVNISKDESMFCPYSNLSSFSNEIFIKLKNDNFLKDFEDISKKDEFIDKLAFYICELNVLHPFNEGNGRALRLFFDMIVTFNGYEYINYEDTLENDDYIKASIDCMIADCEKMKTILQKGLNKVFS
ncbi:MAG: Fic/DOC family protein [Halarcobacter sp.]